LEACAAVLVEPAPIVPAEGRAVVPIATDKLRRPADTRSNTLAAAVAIVAYMSARPRDLRPEPDTPMVQYLEGLHSQDRACNILRND